MNPHARAQELIATAIDFRLTEDELAELNSHLSVCPECRRIGAGIRADATVIGSEPPPRISPTRADSILRAALRPSNRRQPSLRLLAVAAILATLGGGVLVAGLGLVDGPQESPRIADPVTPLPTEPLATPPISGGTAPPAAPPRPPASVAPVTPAPEPPREARLPVRGTVAFSGTNSYLVPGSDGAVLVAVTIEDGTLLVLLNGGTPREGWPILLENAFGCATATVADGSVRAVCFYSDEEEGCVDVCGHTQAYAFDGRGVPYPNWPIAFPGSIESGVSSAPRIVGDRMLLSWFDGFGGEVPDGDLGNVSGRVALLTVEPGGAWQEGAFVPVDSQGQCCQIGPDGTAYGRADHSWEDESPPTTTFSAFDADGMRSGWPVEVQGIASPLAFGPDGRAYATVLGADDTTTRIVLEPNGTVTHSAVLPFAIPEGGYDLNDPGWLWAEQPPLVRSDGGTYVVGEQAVVHVGPTGEIVAGWPYEPPSGFVTVSSCAPGDTGCQDIYLSHAVGPDGDLYLLEAAASASSGSSVTVIGSDGRVLDDWPVTLRRAGAQFWSVAVAPDGTAHVLAAEPEDRGTYSITILAIDPASTVLSRTTILEP